MVDHCIAFPLDRRACGKYDQAVPDPARLQTVCWRILIAMLLYRGTEHAHDEPPGLGVHAAHVDAKRYHVQGE